MKQKIALLGLWLGLSGLVFAQTVPLNVQKTAGTNAITADLVIPSGRSLSASGTGTIGATSVTYTTSVTETAGTGSPEGVVTANIGSIFHRTNGSTGTTIYIKESGTGNTGWVAITSGGGSGDMLLGTAQTVTAAKTYNAGTLKIASGGDLVDTNGNELFKFTATASAVNEVTIANAATAGTPIISATGGDTNVALRLRPKGTGAFEVYAGDSANGVFRFTTPSGFGTTISRIVVGSEATDYFWFSTTTTANNPITGMASGDGGIYVSSGKNIFYSVDGGTTAAGKMDSTGALLVLKPTAGIGYGTGAGGTVTQATSKSTGVTLNKVSGAITLNNASLAAVTAVTFTLTNSAIAATDVVIVNIKSGATAGSYHLNVDSVSAGSCTITLYNYSIGALGEAVVISFAVIKGVTS